ncbi:MAG TPA: sugar ABC transporter permease [Firmicutes bacterium]|nr:sugar ABC transporter permease [Bacillota bacterium]
MARKPTKKVTPYLFLLPNMVLFGAFTIIPAFYGLYISLTRWDIITKPRFVGLMNYVELLNDPYFWNALQRTFSYVAVVIVLQFFTSLALALLLAKPIRLIGLYRATFYMPTMLSFIVIGVIWQWIFGDTFGVVNHLLELAALPRVRWLTTPFTANLSVALATVWARLGFYMVIFVAGINAISDVYYEAAEIDGASRWQRFRHITFPLLRPTNLLVVVLCMIESFKVFGLVLSMTSGGPGMSTTYLIQHVYETGFDQNRMGYASAQSIILFAILLILTTLQLKLTKGGEVDAY